MQNPGQGGSSHRGACRSRTEPTIPHLAPWAQKARVML